MKAKRKVILDQDTLGPASTNLQSIALIINDPDVEVLGICVPTGDHWRDIQVNHALRLLEIMGRTEIPVVPGAIFPLVQSAGDTALWEKLHGKLIYNGAHDLARPGKFADPYAIPDLPEGNPTTKPAEEHAANFLVRMAKKFPGEISLWNAAPLTNLALAVRLEPKLPTLVRELHFMGGCFHPMTESREFKHTPRREFNLRFDPEAARIVLRSPWPKLTCSPIDISQHVKSTPEHFAAIAKSGTPLAAYLDKFGVRNRPLWDEIAAATWLDESLVAEAEDYFIDVNLDRGASYGDVLSWSPGFEPGLGEQRAKVQKRLDQPKFFEMFVDRLSRS